jgi:hypothetical protein
VEGEVELASQVEAERSKPAQPVEADLLGGQEMDNSRAKSSGKSEKRKKDQAAATGRTKAKAAQMALFGKPDKPSGGAKPRGKK